MHLSRANSVSCLWPADILAIKIIVFVANVVVIVVIAVRCGLMENRYWPKDVCVCVRVRFYEKNCILSKVQNMNNERAVFSMQHFPLCKWSAISRTKWEQGHHAVSQTTIKAIFSVSLQNSTPSSFIAHFSIVTYFDTTSLFFARPFSRRFLWFSSSSLGLLKN